MSSMLKNATNLCRTTLNILNSSSRFHHLLTSPAQRTATLPNSTFLAPTVTEFVSKCGFKVKGFLRRRCKDCFFVRREERLFVVCKTHGRHKQMQMVKDPRNTWMLSHATQGKVRPW